MVTLPLPPTTNKSYANVPGRGRVLTGVARTYKREVQQVLMENRCELPGGAGGGPYCLVLWLVFPNRQRRDASNHVKLIEDAAAEYFGHDDSSHHELHIYKLIDRDHPRAVLLLAPKIGPVPSPPDRAREPYSTGLASI